MLNHTSYRAVSCDVMVGIFREKFLLAVISLVEVTADSKIIPALVTVLMIFLWFDCQFLASHAYYK